MKGLMINCKTASEFIVKKDSVKLSFSERFHLFMHLSMCKFCRLFEKQSRVITLSTPKLDDTSIHHLEEPVKEKMLEELKEQA